MKYTLISLFLMISSCSSYQMRKPIRPQNEEVGKNLDGFICKLNNGDEFTSGDTGFNECVDLVETKKARIIRKKKKLPRPMDEDIYPTRPEMNKSYSTDFQDF